jgi:hypothetical protein
VSREVERVAAALLYEGYMLYPYRPSSVKNQRRFNFGVVPPGGGDMQTECLLRGGADTQFHVHIRFLHLIERGTWHEAVERDVRVLGEPATSSFAWPATEGQCAITCAVEIDAVPSAPGVQRVHVRLVNTTVAKDDLGHSLVSAHTILTADNGEWISLLDPPDDLRAEAAACRNVRTWPVLAGDNTMLSSPIILYDYPKTAPESPGDLFDATEIDEILSLRVLTLTEDEQREMRTADAHARRLLERTQALTAEDFMRMHGTMRSPDGGHDETR